MSRHYSIYTDDTPAVWPAFVNPKEDELLSSWLTRIAHAHGYKVHTFCKLCLPGYPIWNRDIDRSAKNKMLEVIAQRTNTSFERVTKTTLQMYWQKLYYRESPNEHWEWIMPMGIYHRKRKRNGLQYCPGCIKQDKDEPYFRTQWRLALLYGCIKCGLQLLDRCPHCNRPVTFFRSELGIKDADPFRSLHKCYWCNNKLYTKGLKDLTQPEMVIQTALLNALNGTILIGKNAFDFFLGYRHLIKLLTSKRKHARRINLSLQEQSGISLHDFASSDYYKLEFLSTDQRKRVLCASWPLLQDWPQNFRLLYNTSKARGSTLQMDKNEVNKDCWFFTSLK